MHPYRFELCGNQNENGIVSHNRCKSQWQKKSFNRHDCNPMPGWKKRWQEKVIEYNCFIKSFYVSQSKWTRDAMQNDSVAIGHIFRFIRTSDGK